MCYDNYLAEKLPINKTKLPSVLQPEYNPVHAARHVDELKRVPNLDRTFKARRKPYITAFEQAANVAKMSCRELEQCLQSLLFKNIFVMNELQLAIWYASQLDQGTESKSLAPRSKPTMDEHNRYRDWASDWTTMQPRDHETRTLILRKATWNAAHNLSDMADMHALRWLRSMSFNLNQADIRHGYKLARAFATDPYVMGHYLAVWFVHDTCQSKFKGMINPMRAINVQLRRMDEARVTYIESAVSCDYQEYMTHRCMMADLEHMQSNPECDNGYKWKCSCTCCREKQLTDHIKAAHEELDTLLNKKDVKLTVTRKDLYEKSMQQTRDYVYKVNVEADFDLVLCTDTAFVGNPNEMGTELYTRLLVELVK